MTDIAQIEKAVDTLSASLDKKFEAYESQLAKTGEVSDDLKSDIKSMSDQYADLSKEQQSIMDSLTQIEQKGVKAEKRQPAMSMGKQFVESDAFAKYRDGASNKARFEFQNNTIIGESGSPQEPTNDIVPLQTMPGLIGGAFRALNLLDLVPTGTATGNTVHYTRELTFTNSAAETAEGAQKPESTLTFEGVDVPVRTIPHFLKVSKQVLDDAPALESYIDRRLSYGVRKKLEEQIINGDGTSPNISGMLDTGNFTSLTAASGDDNFDFANKAKYKVIDSDYQADFYLINPADWGKMERTINATSGDAVGYLQNGLIPTLWGMPVITSNSVPAGKLICASSDAMMYWNRQNATVEIFDQNEDDVEKNLLTVRGELRGAFTVFRPSAIVAGDLPNPSA